MKHVWLHEKVDGRIKDMMGATLENFWWPSLSRQGAGPCTVSMMILVKEQFCSGTFPRASSNSTMPNDHMSADWLYLNSPHETLQTLLFAMQSDGCTNYCMTGYNASFGKHVLVRIR